MGVRKCRRTRLCADGRSEASAVCCDHAVRRWSARRVLEKVTPTVLRLRFSTFSTESSPSWQIPSVPLVAKDTLRVSTSGSGGNASRTVNSRFRTAVSFQHLE